MPKKRLSYGSETISRATPPLSSREFLTRLPDQLREKLPSQWQGFQHSLPFASLVKIYYTHPSIHYELWLQRRTGIVELGLHFEGEPQENARWLEVMAKNYGLISRALGPRIEAEQWTKSWTRIHETLPLESLSGIFLEKIVGRLALMIETLQPILEKEAGKSLQ